MRVVLQLRFNFFAVTRHETNIGVVVVVIWIIIIISINVYVASNCGCRLVIQILLGFELDFVARKYVSKAYSNEFFVPFFLILREL